ncbi:MAG: 4'-phosphopantetheinyl transferase superfamily protein [Bifidobacteriaceae bacterium]|jgi:hypothetical protein|nr:4'-phosphopantetheinyl transferase superfamily protein [Bifidobacteriaceae bacterium]
MWRTMPPGSPEATLVFRAGGFARPDASELARRLVEVRALDELTGPTLRDSSPAPRLTWARTEAGRPYLVELPDLGFSISHSGPYVGAVFAPGACGLDLEVSGRAVNMALTRRFAPEEGAFVVGGRRETAGARLLEIWTKKEAYLKWAGRGLAGGLESFSVLDPAGLGVRFIQLSGGPRGDLVGFVCLDADAAGSASPPLRERWVPTAG